MKSRVLAALAAAAILTALPAAAAVLDQASVPESGPFSWGSYNSSSHIVQTFTVGRAGVLDRIEIALLSTGDVTDGLVFELFSTPLDLAAAFPTPLASAVIPRAGLPTSSSFSLSELTVVDLSTANLTVGVGDVFAFSVRGRVFGTNPAPGDYIGGQGFYANFSDGFLAGNDHGFRTYVAVVPEPATWALMIGGFGLAGVALRRRTVRIA